MDMIRPSIAILFCSSSAVIAQKPDTTSICWRASALASCKSWIVSEVAVVKPYFSTQSRTERGGGIYPIDDFAAHVAITLGGMRNVRPDAAIGLTGSLMAASILGELPARIEARYRRWHSPTIGFDVSAGWTGGPVTGTDPHVWRPLVRSHGVTGSVGFSHTYIGVDARANLVWAADGRILRSTSLGLRAGSRTFPIAFLGFMLMAIGAGYGAAT
jgi:hypothetical protein